MSTKKAHLDIATDTSPGVQLIRQCGVGGLAVCLNDELDVSMKVCFFNMKMEQRVPFKTRIGLIKSDEGLKEKDGITLRRKL